MDFETFLESTRSAETYFKTYTAAIAAALEGTKKRGYVTDPEEVADIVGLQSKRPKDGKTTSLKIPVYKSESEFGNPPKKYLAVQVYNRGNRAVTPYELNSYIT